MTAPNQPHTTLRHGALPYPAGTLVIDVLSERTGLLVGVLEECAKEGGAPVRRQAFMRPQGGGLEWDVPLERIRPAAGHRSSPPPPT
ncbi:hypothetical protein [Streptomyces halstedii]|uniref:Uncharacterized protein n=1 Tax=Streptomyces halstedii TaxID=1944 RepID=A0A6N9U2D2_STRHA|nr:hypothetical protein [Streptomyces halstedii]NEA17950.1 hypothetical protein [Streptomyces halstedii]